MKFQAYRVRVWEGIKEGALDNARTALADLQSVYHDIHTGSAVGAPSARTGTMEIVEGEQDVYRFAPPVLESDPADDIAADRWHREAEPSQAQAPEKESAPEMTMEG